MLQFDPIQERFFTNEPQTARSTCNIARDATLSWRFAFSVGERAKTDGKRSLSEYLPHLGLGHLDVQGKSVLVVGEGDGMELLYALSRGAREVHMVGSPQSGGCIQLLNELLGVSIGFTEGDLTTLLPTLPQFDVVIAQELLTASPHPLFLLEKVSALCAESLLLVTHIVDADGELPFTVLYPDNELDDFAGASAAPNRAWLDIGLRRCGFHCDWSNEWSTQFDTKRVSLLSRRTLPKRYSSPEADNLPLDIGEEGKTAVLVMTCRRFEQVWRPFFELFKKYWPDCPYEVFLGTDSGSYPGVKMIQVGTDRGWADNTLFCLRALPHDRVILFQEDFLLNASTNTDVVRKLVRYSRHEGVGCIRLMPVPGPSRRWRNSSLLGAIAATDPYRLSLQLAIWKRELLLSLIKEGESPWQTEEYGTARAALSSDSFLSVQESVPHVIPYFVTGVVQGEWQEGALELLTREGISLQGITKKIPR